MEIVTITEARRRLRGALLPPKKKLKQSPRKLPSAALPQKT